MSGGGMGGGVAGAGAGGSSGGGDGAGDEKGNGKKTGKATVRVLSWREWANKQHRERRRRATRLRIFRGPRKNGDYTVPRHCDTIEVLKALCNIEGSEPPPAIGGSAPASPGSSSFGIGASSSWLRVRGLEQSSIGPRAPPPTPMAHGGGHVVMEPRELLSRRNGEYHGPWVGEVISEDCADEDALEFTMGNSKA